MILIGKRGPRPFGRPSGVPDTPPARLRSTTRTRLFAYKFQDVGEERRANHRESLPRQAIIYILIDYKLRLRVGAGGGVGTARGGGRCFFIQLLECNEMPRAKSLIESRGKYHQKRNARVCSGPESRGVVLLLQQLVGLGLPVGGRLVAGHHLEVTELGLQFLFPLGGSCNSSIRQRKINATHAGSKSKNESKERIGENGKRG